MYVPMPNFAENSLKSISCAIDFFRLEFLHFVQKNILLKNFLHF
jgi:hypothetical protein